MSDRYKKFYCEYKNKLFSYLLYKSGDHEVASDVMQESFARHFQRYGNEAVISPALLFAIARNVLIDHHRYQKRFTVVEQISVEAPLDEEQSRELREQTQRIHNALQKLPEQDRELLSLATGGIAYKEIAGILGISVANVKVRVHRIRNRLRSILNDEVE